MDYRTIILSLEEDGFLTINNENLDYAKIEQLIKDKKKEGDNKKKEGDNEKKEGDNEKKEGDNEKKEGDNEKKEGDNEKKEGEKNSKPFKFFSNSTIGEDSDYRLCNLYGCKIDNYPSVQHAFESLKYPKIQRVRFTVDGDLANFDALSKFYDGDELEKVRTRLEKKGMIGKVAILSSMNCRKIGLSNPQKVHANQMIPILRKKFEIDEFRRVLLSTGDRYLLNFVRVPRENPGLEFWGGCIREDKLYGENTLGQYLTKIRDELV